MIDHNAKLGRLLIKRRTTAALPSEPGIAARERFTSASCSRSLRNLRSWSERDSWYSGNQSGESQDRAGISDGNECSALQFQMSQLELWGRIRGRPAGAGTSELTALHRMRHAISGQGTGYAYPLRSCVACHAVASGIVQPLELDSAVLGG